MIWVITKDENNLHDQNLEPVVVAQPFSKYFPIDHYQGTEVYKLKICFNFDTTKGQNNRLSMNFDRH